MKKLWERLLKIPRMHLYLWMAAGVFIGLFFAFLTTVMVKSTSDDKFCSSCHAMEPVTMSYHEDVHGGNNAFGFKAHCADCHLPGESVLGYLWVKQTSGIKDTFRAIFFDSSKTNWEEKSFRRADFVFDSGCVRCHEGLENSPKMSQAAQAIHKEYFEKRPGNSHFNCVNCHQHVGHKNLLEHTERFFKKK